MPTLPSHSTYRVADGASIQSFSFSEYIELLYGSIRLGTADRFRSPVQIGTDPRLQCQAEAL